MVSSALSGFGTTLNWDGQDLAELTSINGPSIKVNPIDVTNDDSASGFVEVIGGIGDGGEITVEGNFIPGNTAGQIALVADMIAKSKKTLIITGPTAGAFTWTVTSCLCTAFEPSHPFDDKISFTATFKVSGVPSLTVTASDNLSALTVTTATLVPAFSATKYSYTANTTGTSVTVTPTCAGATTIDVYADGTLVSSLASGGTSSAIAITTAANVEITIRVKTTGKVDKVYTLYLFKSA